MDMICDFLHHDSYWVKGIAKELIWASIENSSICYGIYKGNPLEGNGQQVGFARVVTDFVRFSHLGDVFVLPEYRGRGLSKWMLSIIIEHPQLKGTYFSLATKDAHTLYEQFGFQSVENMEKRMARSLNWEAVYKGHRLKN
ncbi:GNAT family N-acetyltransferase [Niallia nealsonii]|uniref:GNAT family N-acetyltransferase n=2 Tax=Niallia nealsonii TaxID=115979 RepID=A0A2N0Z1U1_9BACI|nr:GNAT family N-acetyltransferase [Niallia nealsonii]